MIEKNMLNNKYLMKPKLVIAVIVAFFGERVIACSDDYAAAIVVTAAAVGLGTIGL